MSRRFRRENFLFPQDLREASVQVEANAVDPFERASEGAVVQSPARQNDVNRPDQNNRLVDLSASLGIVNRNVGQIADRQYKDISAANEQVGAQLAVEDERRGNKQNWRQFISRTRIDGGEAAGRDVLSMNPHVQRGFDQTRARSSALNYNAAVQSAFASNPEVEEGVRLHDIDVSDPRYLQWQSGFQQQFNADNGLDTIDPLALSLLIPAQQDADNRVTMAHDELRGKIKLSQFEDSTAEFVETTIFDLNSNAEWLQGNDNQALELAANNISNQIDEANALGFGGADLEGIHNTVIEMLISAATTTNNPVLLNVARLIETGPPNDRQLLLSTAKGAKYRSVIGQAEQSIVDRDFALDQRARTVRDQDKEDSMNSTLENIAVMAGLYENLGRTPEARQALDDVINAGREEAALHGYTPEFNGIIQRTLQDSVDNQGTPIIDYAAMARLESDIDGGLISGEAAKTRVRDLYITGALGNNQQAADNMLRLNSKVKASTDQAYAQSSNEIDSAASSYAEAVRGRLGYTTDERGRVMSVKDTLAGAGFNEAQMSTLMSMDQAALETAILNNQRLAANNGATAYSAATIEAMRLVVNGGINPLNPPAAVDPGDIQRQEIEFKNTIHRGLQTFREENGRDMTPQERGEYIRDSQEAALNGQLASLPMSNPLASTRNPSTAGENFQSSIYDSVLEGIADNAGNARNTKVVDQTQLINAYSQFVNTRAWHPEFTALAAANGMSPMSLFQTQSSLFGVDIDPDMMIDIGLAPTPASVQAGNLPGTSTYTSEVDISQGYSQGSYTTYKDHYTDDSPPGSFDFTFLQNGSDAVNVPAPFDGVVVEVMTPQQSGGYGNLVVIKDRSTNQQMLIAHLDAVYLKAGDRFVRGQAIMKQGTTGNSTGPHLHVEVLDRNGVRITNRDYTRPIVDDWVRDVESGYHLQPSQNTQSSAGLQPNSRPAQYGHPGYDTPNYLTTVHRAPDGYEYKLQPQAATAWRRMVNDAKYEGIALTPVSAFRSVEEQQRLWDAQVQRQGSPEAAARVSAPPGHSEHHTGLTLDINSLETSFENTPAFQWLTNNSARYGFTMSYPKDGSGAAGYEPWHWSYSGIQTGGVGGGAQRGRAGQAIPGQSGSSAGRSGGNSNFRPTRQIGLGQSIASSAGRLGVKPDELASVLALESSLDINSRGGDGDRYVGLWQAGPDVQSRYGVYQGMPAGQQMAALETYLEDRGYEPGMGIAALYSTILAGNPWDVDSADSNQTTASSAATMFRPGGRHHNTAREILGF